MKLYTNGGWKGCKISNAQEDAGSGNSFIKALNPSPGMTKDIMRPRDKSWATPKGNKGAQLALTNAHRG